MLTLNALVYEKDGETFVWAFREGEEQKALESLCEFANRDDVNFTWYDANLVWQRMAEVPSEIRPTDPARDLVASFKRRR